MSKDLTKAALIRAIKARLPADPECQLDDLGKLPKDELKKPCDGIKALAERGDETH